jgi:hypothetical protein
MVILLLIFSDISFTILTAIISTDEWFFQTSQQILDGKNELNAQPRTDWLSDVIERDKNGFILTALI